MRKLLTLVLLTGVAASMTGCAYIGSQTDLAEVAQRTGLSNVTTGDGTFADYTAVGYYTGLEFGIGVGIWGWKIIELTPNQNNEDLLVDVANEAKANNANAMINVTPHTEFFVPILFPFGGIGIYFDRASGTGIQVK